MLLSATGERSGNDREAEERRQFAERSLDIFGNPIGFDVLRTLDLEQFLGLCAGRLRESVLCHVEGSRFLRHARLRWQPQCMAGNRSAGRGYSGDQRQHANHRRQVPVDLGKGRQQNPTRR